MESSNAFIKKVEKFKEPFEVLNNKLGISGKFQRIYLGIYLPDSFNKNDLKYSFFLTGESDFYRMWNSFVALNIKKEILHL